MSPTVGLTDDEYETVRRVTGRYPAEMAGVVDCDGESVALTTGQRDLLLGLMSADLDVLSPGRQLRAVAPVAPSEESQTMLPPTPKVGGEKACQAISEQDSPARSRRAKGPTVKPRPPWARDVAHWPVRNGKTGLVSDRRTGASWDHETQRLWCECGNVQDCHAPDLWEPGDVLTCRECAERWTIVGEKLDNKEV